MLIKIYKIFLKPSSLKLGLLITAICLALLFRHYSLPRNSLDIIGQIEQILYDLRFKIRGNQPYSGRIGVLAADDKSVERFGRWPFPRDIYTQALTNLKKAGVKWIGFDVFFSEPSRRYLDESVQDIKALFIEQNLSKEEREKKLLNLSSMSPGDLSLAQAISDFDNVVQGFFFIENKSFLTDSNYDWRGSFSRVKNSSLDFVMFPEKKSFKDYPELISYGAVSNTAVIANKAKYMGFANNHSDSDGLIRKATLVKGLYDYDLNGEKIVGEPILLPSLALSLASHYLNMGITANFDSIGVQSIELIPEDSKKESIKIPLYFDGNGTMLINHYGPFYEIPTVSLHDAYDNKLPKKMPEVLVYGGTATGTNDKRPSPFDENFDGVGHHVAVIENIITQKFMTRPLQAPLIEVSVLLITGIIFSLVLKFMSALRSAIFILFVSVAFYFIDKKILFVSGNWYYIGIFYTQSLSIYFGITIFKYFTEEREKKKVKTAFQHYLNPAVINQLMEHPEKLKLGGEKKSLTIFFSDVRGFTTISETLTAEKLTSVLNEYFTPMTKIVLDSNGLLDKYIGDALMAFWGAPIPLEDHADRALESALKMFDELESLQNKWAAEGLPYLDIGIGINTGEVVVGNMGSDQRFDYTVLGDSVNLASRLEGINKNYGTRLICSEFTLNHIKNREKFIVRELDNIKVKGKSEPVRIFEVMRLKSHGMQNIKKAIQLFEVGLQLYREQKWKKASDKFKEVLKIMPNDGPSEEYLERCKYLSVEGVDKDWDGVWVFKSK